VNRQSHISTQLNILKLSFGCVILVMFSIYGEIYGQTYNQKLSGVVIDSESRSPLQGANIVVETFSKAGVATTDSVGKFSLMLPPGRHTLRVSYLGYNTRIIKDILVGTGKEVFITADLTESRQQISQIVVNAESRRTINSMATVSVRRLRSQDAARYAGGYYDPLRMVTTMPGVSAGNDDGSNEIIIRGNSPAGLLWRLEGIEIPNPNHLSAGQGASSGAFSSITTNSLSGFDFYTAAFPAEFGNAYSGVMDLNLRSGSTSKREYSLGLSVVGAEVSAEGPLNKISGSSYFGNFRYANFSFLSKYGVIDIEDVGIVPRSMDWAFKTSIKTKKLGTFDFFSIGGSSLVGDLASTDAAEIKSGGDKDEYKEEQFMAVAGIKHMLVLPDSKTYIRTTIGYTYEQNVSDNYTTDTSLKKTLYYEDSFKYPSLRISSQLNHKFNSAISLRVGFTHNSITGNMYARRLLTGIQYDTLINTSNRGWYNSYYFQWKFRPSVPVEINTGLHLFHSGITNELVWEPRIGFVFHLNKGQTINLGAGFHSRLEPLSIYSYRIKTGNTRNEKNSGLKTIKALHFTVGHNVQFGPDLNMGFEAYLQSLYDVPVALNKLSQYSILNSSYGLPDMILDNNGNGLNYGVELTIEKDFTHNYYFLLAASLFDSRYKAADGNWYNTYYNNGYIFSATGGKEFIIGHKGQNLIGFNIKALDRGGFRYTPVDEKLTLSRKRIVYKTADTYGSHLPPYMRIDLGFSYRLNKANKAWIFMIDIQNVTNRKNIVRKKFSYQAGNIVESYSRSIGLVPVGTIKIEF